MPVETNLSKTEQLRNLERVPVGFDDNGLVYTNHYDAISGEMPHIDHPHEELHAGMRFVTVQLSTLTGLGAISFLVPVGTKPSHMVVKVSTDQAVSVAVYESPTTSANGTGLTVYTRNRASTNTTATTVYSGPSVSANGNMIHAELVGASRSSGTSRSADEIIFKASTKYLVTVTNLTNQTANYSCELDWYEE